MITLPVGLNLDVVSRLSGMSLGAVTKAALLWMQVIIYIRWLTPFFVGIMFLKYIS